MMTWRRSSPRSAFAFSIDASSGTKPSGFLSGPKPQRSTSGKTVMSVAPPMLFPRRMVSATIIAVSRETSNLPVPW